MSLLRCSGDDTRPRHPEVAWRGRRVRSGVRPGARVLKRFAPEPSKTDRGALDRYVAHHGQRGRAPETPVGVDEMGPLDPTDLTMTPGEWVEIRVSRGDKRG